MKQSKPLVTEVVSMRATEYSADGKNVTISLTTKYSSERFFSIPLTCLYDLIADLEKLKSSTNATPAKAGNESGKGKKSTDLRSDPAAKPAGHQINVKVPKKWMLASGLPSHPMVILVLDPQTEAQAGFGFSDSAARQMADGLVKYADAIAKHSSDKPKLA